MSPSLSLPRRYEDPETSRDPRVRAVVKRLAAVDHAPAPDPEFRAELRRQLVAIAARVVDETADAASSTAHDAKARTTGSGAGARAHGRPRRSFGKPLGIATACVAVLALGFGGVVWKSQSALPGDSLYGLKRTSESVRLSLASGDTDKGHEYLSLATTRVHEAQDLLGHDSALGAGSGVLAAGVSSHTLSLIRDTLSSSDADVRSGAALLRAQSADSTSRTPFTIMADWAPDQLGLLSQLADSVGEGSTRAAAQHSWNIVNAAFRRVKASADHCGTSVQGSAPCPSATPPTRATNTPSVRTPSTSTTSSRPKPSVSASSTPARRHRSGTGSPTTSGPSTTRHRSGNAAPLLPDPTKKLHVSTLPPGSPRVRLGSGLPSTPISVGTCGLKATIGPIGVRVGTCPSGH